MKPTTVPRADSLLLLLATWAAVYAWLVVHTVAWLGRAPAAEPAGSVFFARAPGMCLPASVVVMLSAALFVLHYRRGGFTARLALRFALLNAAFILGQVASLRLSEVFVGRLAQAVLAPGPEARRAWLPLLLTLAWVAVLLAAQAWGLQARRPAGE